MIIVSQGKTANINYENIEAIYLLKKNGKMEINARGKYDYTIGTYTTEERVKEVLEEIEKCYLNTEQYKCLSSMPNCESEEKVNVLNKLAENAFIYIMPES